MYRKHRHSKLVVLHAHNTTQSRKQDILLRFTAFTPLYIVTHAKYAAKRLKCLVSYLYSTLHTVEILIQRHLHKLRRL